MHIRVIRDSFISEIRDPFILVTCDGFIREIRDYISAIRDFIP